MLAAGRPAGLFAPCVDAANLGDTMIHRQHAPSLIQVLEYQEYNMSFVGSGNSEEIVLLNNVPISPYTVIGVSMRVHARDIGGGGSFKLILRGINPSPADGRDFVYDPDLGTVTLDASTPMNVPGVLQLASPITNPQQPFLRVVLEANGPTSGNLYCVISADLTTKTG